ncbi:MAG TPA: FMN-binding protein [Candidatus Saccharimonadales bacterium]|nr:FMN-binding protein [Candidatus Saccharimonadales bacterium]
MKKKIALALAVIVAFIGYSYHSRHDGSESAVVTPPSPTQQAAMQPATTTPGTTPNAPTTAAYKDGTYTGPVTDAFYGNVQVQVTVSGGKITAVQFLQHPNDNPTSRAINAQADPYLVQEAIQAQSAQVDTITGATDTSLAFVQSLTAALTHAQ